MVNLFLWIVAWVAFFFVACVGIPYSAIWYVNHEKEKPMPYSRRNAIAVDKMCNAAFGEFVEMLIAKERRVTYFGTDVTISASIGHLIATDNANKRAIRLSEWLNKRDKKGNHCLRAYQEEILSIKN